MKRGVEMAQFEVQFDLKGCMTVDAESYHKAEEMAKKKLGQYKDSMSLHFKKDIDVEIDDVEKIS
jgi:hypothetical protein